MGTNVTKAEIRKTVYALGRSLGTNSSPEGIKEWMQSVNFSPTPDSDQLKICALTDVKIASIASLFTGKVQDRVNYILRTHVQ